LLQESFGLPRAWHTHKEVRDHLEGGEQEVHIADTDSNHSI